MRAAFTWSRTAWPSIPALREWLQGEGTRIAQNLSTSRRVADSSLAPSLRIRRRVLLIRRRCRAWTLRHARANLDRTPANGPKNSSARRTVCRRRSESGRVYASIRAAGAAPAPKEAPRSRATEFHSSEPASLRASSLRPHRLRQLSEAPTLTTPVAPTPPASDPGEFTRQFAPPCSGPRLLHRLTNRPRRQLLRRTNRASLRRQFAPSRGDAAGAHSASTSEPAGRVHAAFRRSSSEACRTAAKSAAASGRVYQTISSAAAAPNPPSQIRVPPPAELAPQPGEFTQMLQAQRPAAPPQPQSPQSGEFTRYFQSPMTPSQSATAVHMAPSDAAASAFACPGTPANSRRFSGRGTALGAASTVAGRAAAIPSSGECDAGIRDASAH